MISKKNIVFFSLKIDFVFTNKADTYEMHCYAIFYLGLHYLQNLNERVLLSTQNTCLLMYDH